MSENTDTIRDKVITSAQRLEDFIVNQTNTNERVEEDMYEIKQALKQLLHSEVRFEMILKERKEKADKIGIFGTSLLMVIISGIVNFISAKLFPPN